jgi:cell division protein FtsQ
MVIFRRLGLSRRSLLVVAAGLPVVFGGWLWLRDSSLVSVEHVRITGVHGADALEIRQALDAAARRMTTMDFNTGALRVAVQPFSVVSAVSATTSFPHTVRIAVSERPPIAALLSGGQRTAVAGDGTVLGASLLTSALPTINGASEPTPGAKVSEPSVLFDLDVLDAAPSGLRRFVARLFEGHEGLTVAMRNGLLVYFGNANRPHAKWSSLARVLAAPSAAGAWYVDVRVPERPAAGISGASSSTPIQTGASDPTAAALAARLAVAVGGGSTGSTASSSGQSESSSESRSEPSKEPSTGQEQTPQSEASTTATTPSQGG